MTRFNGIAAAAVVLVLGAASAQDAPTPQVQSRKGPTILVRPDPGQPSQPLRVSGVSAEVVIVSGIASVRLDLTFENPLDRVLEGELVLPLPRGATVSSFALEVGDKLREASVVEREKARAVFEAVVRQGVDPGLLEWVQGNNFRTRIYPIPAKGTKRVVLGYDQPLADAGGTAPFVLPLAYGTKIRNFSCKVTVMGEAAPVVAKDGLPLKFEKAGPSWKGSIQGSEVAEMEPRDLVLGLALPTTGSETVIERARVKAPLSKDPELVFVSRIPVPEIAASKIKPGRVTIIWDASGSAASRDIEKEIAFLVAYFKALGTAEVKLVVFSNDLWAIEKDAFRVNEGKCDELLKTLADIRPDGGTRLGCLDLKKLDAATDQFILMSDGLSNFGEGEIVLGEKPVSCIVSASSADFELLDRIASKGALVNLLEVGTAEAVSRALSEPRTLLGIDFDGARVAEIYPPMPSRLDGRVVSLAGRVSAGEKTKLMLHFGHGAVESARVEVLLDPATLTDTGRAERIWATRKIETLSRDKTKNEDEIVRTAKAHAIVTPFTSLLVLDTIDQYVRYRVVPPKDMEDEYWKRVEAEKAQAAKGRDERIAQVKTKWAARVDWWNKEFKYPENLKVAPEKDKGGGLNGNPAQGVPAPAPPMEPGGDRARRMVARDEMEAAKKDDKSSGEGRHEGGITLKPWDPNTPYVAAYKKVTDPKSLYACYLDQRKANATSTAFFLDSADYFYAQSMPALALRILSNLAELQLENAPLLRILGYRLKQAGELQLAIATFKTVQRIRPEEPQSFRDLGLAQADAKDWTNAVANLEKVVLGNWDARFPDIDLIALGELNNVIAKGGKSGCTLPDDLIKALDYDLRIILTWDADMCDMDLWVVEPSGERAFYGHRATQTGGAFGQDFTQGYGPEEYLVKKAMKGDFKIQVNYYGNRQQLLAGDTTIQVTIVKNYGRPNEERREVTRRLKEKAETIDIAEVAFGK